MRFVKEHIADYITKVEGNWVIIVAAVIFLNMLINISIYYNTNNFYVSEAKAGYLHLDKIQHGEKLPIFLNAYRTTIPHIASWFIDIFGSIVAFFWFQSLLATLSVYLLFKLIYNTTKSRIAAILGLCLATIYVDFHLLVPVLYDQIFEVFFSVLILYLVMILFQTHRFFDIVFITIIIALTYYLSLFFRGTLRYYSYVVLFICIVCLLSKDWKASLKLLLAFILMLSIVKLFPLSKYALKTSESSNNFRFFGHTMYGGDGGEGAFIYEKNRILYEKKLSEYLTINSIDSVNTKVLNKFQAKEIDEFIKNHPIQWMQLQLRKISYTFGIVPTKDSLTLLKTGKLKLGLVLSMLIIQLPYILLMLLFVSIITITFNFKDIFRSKFLVFWVSFVYFIAATCLYGHYQERYRIVVIMSTMIPLICIYSVRIREQFMNSMITKKRVLLAAIFVVLVLLNWGFQAYQTLIVHSTRFLSNI